MTDKDWIDGEIINTNIKRDLVPNIIWTTKEGRKIRLGDMEDSHIRNCALFLTNFGYQRCIAKQEVRLKWLRVFSLEWERRILARESKNRKFNYIPTREETILALLKGKS